MLDNRYRGLRRGQHGLLSPLWLSLSWPFLPSYERLLLHAVCQYMDLISASECLLPTAPSPPFFPEKPRLDPLAGDPQGVLGWVDSREVAIKSWYLFI